MARDHRHMEQFEEALRQSLKCKALGLAPLQWTIARQESRVLWLSKGDTSTLFFHSYANSRKPRNHVHSLVCDGG
jgi:hypothetical protein